MEKLHILPYKNGVKETDAQDIPTLPVELGPKSDTTEVKDVGPVTEGHIGLFLVKTPVQADGKGVRP